MSKFSDPVDEASHVEEMFTQRSIDAVLANGSRTRLAFTGRCHNCEEPVAEPLRFCDSECLEDYEYVQQRKRANGRA